MRWHWYIAKPDELFIDIDVTRQTLSKLGKAWARIRGAKRSGALAVDRFWFYRSATAYHYHIMVKLHKPLSPTERLIWEARFMDDYFRNQMNGGRLLRYGQTYSLLIAPAVRTHYHRAPDYSCDCAGKHKDLVIAQCPVAHQLGSEFRLDAGCFGQPFVTDEPLRCDVPYSD